MKRQHWFLLAALLVLGCTAANRTLLPPATGIPDGVPTPIDPLARAEVSVEVWSGFTQRPGAATNAAPERVEIVLDLTSSMEAASEGVPPRYMGARESAARLLAALPSDTEVGVRALGISAGSECVGTTDVAHGTPASFGRGLRTHIRALRPRSEGSLAGALQSIVTRPGGELDRTRVVVFTDLGAECGGDLCAAGSALAAAGARLEFVLLADAAVPECFASFAPETLPRIATTPVRTPQPNFRIESHDIDSPRRGDVIAHGRADGERVSLPPVHVLIVVEMDPPALVGPIALEPNGHTHIRILDFPTLDPPVREWGWTTEPAMGTLVRGPGAEPGAVTAAEASRAQAPDAEAAEAATAGSADTSSKAARRVDARPETG